MLPNRLRMVCPCPLAGKKKCCHSRIAGAEISTTTNKSGGRHAFEGGRYCGEVRYVAEGDPLMQAQCHCRECQYISGGAPNTFIAMPAAGFSYITGQPKQFTRKDPRARRHARILRRMRHPSS